MLYEYSLFVEEIRKKLKSGMSLKEGIHSAVEECIRRGILEKILRGNKAEVTDMLMKEYDEALHIANEKEISYEEGFLDGQLKEREKAQREKEKVQEENRTIKEQRDVLKYKLQGKENDEISLLTKMSLKKIEEILDELNK